MGGWQQAAPPGQGFFNPHHQQQQFPVQHHQAPFPPSQGGGGHIGGYPMNQGMGQGQFSGFPQHQQQFQAMQQQQQQQVIHVCLFRVREGGGRERGRKCEREEGGEGVIGRSCFPVLSPFTADGLHPGAAAIGQRRTEEKRLRDTKAKTYEH